MIWDVEYTDEFGKWWSGLSEDEQESLDASVRLLEDRGPNLGFPHSSGVNRSKHSHMRELRTQHDGRPYRGNLGLGANRIGKTQGLTLVFSS
jgi:hypothetical protein